MDNNELEQTAKEWFQSTPGMFVVDLVDRYGISKGQAQNWVSRWARDLRPEPKPKPVTATSEYWRIAKSMREELYAEYSKLDTNLTYETWRIMRTRQLRDEEMAKLDK
jgi:transposase-like protein